MLELFSTLCSSSGIGALVGLAGSWLTKREERKNLTLKYEQEIRLAALNQAQQKSQNEMKLKLAEIGLETSIKEGEIAQDVAETNAFTASLNSEQNTGSPIVDGIRGIMRPLLTLYLLGVATFISIEVSQLVNMHPEVLDVPRLMTIYEDAIARLMFLATTAVTWWFGSRPGRYMKMMK